MEIERMSNLFQQLGQAGETTAEAAEFQVPATPISPQRTGGQPEVTPAPPAPPEGGGPGETHLGENRFQGQMMRHLLAERFEGMAGSVTGGAGPWTGSGTPTPGEIDPGLQPETIGGLPDFSGQPGLPGGGNLAPGGLGQRLQPETFGGRPNISGLPQGIGGLISGQSGMPGGLSGGLGAPFIPGGSRSSDPAGAGGSQGLFAGGGPGDLRPGGHMPGGSGGMTVIRVPAADISGPQGLPGGLQSEWNAGQAAAQADLGSERIDQWLNARIGSGILDNETVQGYQQAAEAALDDVRQTEPGTSAPSGSGDPDVAEALDGKKPAPSGNQGAGGTEGSGESGDTDSTSGNGSTEETPTTQETDPEDPPKSSGDSVDGDGQDGAPPGYTAPGGPAGPAIWGLPDKSPETNPDKDTGHLIMGDRLAGATLDSRDSESTDDSGHRLEHRRESESPGSSTFDPDGFIYNRGELAADDLAEGGGPTGKS